MYQTLTDKLHEQMNTGGEQKPDEHTDLLRVTQPIRHVHLWVRQPQSSMP